MAFNMSKALDAGGIQIKPVIYALPLIAAVLTYIFNLIIQSGIFPDDMSKI